MPHTAPAYASKDALLKAQEFGTHADDSAANEFAAKIGEQKLCDDDCVVETVTQHNYRRNGDIVLPVVHEETVRANSDLQTYEPQSNKAVLHPTFYQSYEVITGDGRTSTRTIVRPCSDMADNALDKTFGSSFRTNEYAYKNERIKGDGTDKTSANNFYLYDEADLFRVMKKLGPDHEPGKSTHNVQDTHNFRNVLDLQSDPLFTVVVDGKTYYASKDLVSF